MNFRKISFILLSNSWILPVSAQEIMPPTTPWSGKSLELIANPTNPWITPAESSDLTESPDYTETMAWLEKLSQASPSLSINRIGTSEQGRMISVIIASSDQDFSASELSRSKKPLILIQAGIHAGEIDGKDAGMMLLRDIAVGSKAALLERANLLFVPILNVDGHERSSEYGRVNQRGPKIMGWRTNAQNLNLNRDYTKLETAGIKAIIQLINAYDPDLYIDIHVTDGADYQYDITYDFVAPGGYSPQIFNWMKTHYKPEVNQALSANGHIPGPLLFAANDRDFTEGNIAFSFSPRFSNSYGDIRHLPTILVENHSLKPFKQRVLGTYVFLEQSIISVADHFEALRSAVEADKNQPKKELPVRFGFNRNPVDSLVFLGIESQLVKSPITGAEYVQWKGNPITQTIPNILMDKPESILTLPKAYWISSEWPQLIEKIKAHGIQFETISGSKTQTVQQDFIASYKLSAQPSEGRVRFQEFKIEPITREIEFPAGSVRIPVDQSLGELLVILMEPESVDSFFQWGYFHSILSQTEYMETYIMEPLIAKMLAEDANLKIQFEEKMKTDLEFAKSPRSIYRWFYEKTPYFDQQWKVIPIGKEF
jgi:murein tripeptide amidase MpaA